MISTRPTQRYDGLTTSYCSMSASLAGLPAQEAADLSPAQLETLRSSAASLESSNLLQEAIWLYQEDPSSSDTVLKLKEQLLTTLNSNNYTMAPTNLGGAVEKYMLTFSNGIKAIFKPMESVYTEVSAYDLDELLQLGLVPMTIDRTIRGQRGSVQYFVQSMTSGSPAHVVSVNFRKMAILDFLIRNSDRATNNFLYWSSQNRVIAIDHEKAFADPCGIPSEIRSHLKVEQTVAAKVANLTETTFTDALSDIPNFYKKTIWHQIEQIK